MRKACTPRTFPLGNEFFNLYLVQGETCAVIDGGVSGITYPVLDQLGRMGIPMERITYLVVLHAHFDHMMVFPFLKEKYPWMKVVSSELSREAFSNERILTKIYDSDRSMTLKLMQKGLISEAPALAPLTSFPLDAAVGEGSVLDLGRGVKLRFLETPGHSPDGLCACEEGEGTLFCSDAAGFYAPPDFFRPNYWFSLKEADRSFEKMKAVGAEVLCRGHYGAIRGKEAVGRHLEKAHRSIEEFERSVSDWIQKGLSAEEMTREVTERFSKNAFEFFSAEENLRLWRLLVRRTLEYLEKRGSSDEG